MKKKVMFRIRSMQMGGVPKVLIDILKNLDRDKFEPSVLLSIHQGELLSEIPEDVKVISLEKGKETMSSLKAIRLFQLIKRKINLQLYKTFPSLLRKKTDEIPDIEIAITHSSLPYLIRSPFLTSKKINWFHTDIRWHHTIEYGKKIASMMQKCDLTIFGSLHTKLTFEKHLNINIPNSMFIHNTFDVQNVTKKSREKDSDIGNIFSKEEKIFLSVGRLEHQKGYDILIEIHAELLKEGFDHKIIVIGSGSKLNLLEEKIRTLDVEHSFILLGNKNNPYPYIKNADYYIQPSRYESYPIVLGETLILNIPIICTDVGGVTELLIHEETAYIVKFEKNSIKDAMKKFMQTPLLVEKIRKEQSNFQANEYNKKIYSKINNLLLEISCDEAKSKL